jgi:GT2 family glycosyltransferase
MERYSGRSGDDHAAVFPEALAAPAVNLAVSAGGDTIDQFAAWRTGAPGTCQPDNSVLAGSLQPATTSGANARGEPDTDFRMQLHWLAGQAATHTAQIAQLQQRLARLGQAQSSGRGALQHADSAAAPRASAAWRCALALSRAAQARFGHADLLHVALAAPFMLPAYLAWRAGRTGLLRPWLAQPDGLVPQMIGVQDDIRECLLARPRGFRRLATRGFAIAARIHESRSPLRAFDIARRIRWRQGADALQRWLDLAAPGMVQLSPINSPAARGAADTPAPVAAHNAPPSAAALALQAAARVAAHLQRGALADPASAPPLRHQATVDASIIVMACGAPWPETQACIVSLLTHSHDSALRFELILADDASDGGPGDSALRVLQAFGGLRHVRSPRPIGAVNCANLAAAQARGHCIVFLDAGARVLPGWLQALHATLESDPSVAIVGPKWLSAGGQIVDAGGVLRADGSWVHLSTGLDAASDGPPVVADHLAFNHLRETDFISSGCLAVRKSFWVAARGFDPRYTPGFGEAQDLAMAARDQGWRVVYQPAAELLQVHPSTQPMAASAEHWLLHASNSQQLIAKWAEALHRDHLGPDSCWHQLAAHADRHGSPLARERRRRGQLNILYFSPFPSHPASHGNQSTIQQFAQRFQQLSHRVHFVLLGSSLYNRQDLAEMTAAWDSLDLLPRAACVASGDGRPIPFDAWYDAALGPAIGALCASHDIDLVFCSYVFQSKLLEFVPAHVLKVIDTHDKMGDRYEMLKAGGQPLEFFSCTPADEGAYLRRADIVVARRDEEARYFDSVSGRRSAIVVPHFEAARFIDKRHGVLGRVGVVASANQVNLALILELIQALDHALAGCDCPFTLEVAGQVKDMVHALPAQAQAIFRKPWVRLLGFVPDISAFYAAVDVVVSPVTMGTGINVKTVQALAHGAPLLSTAWGTKGIGTDEPLHQHADLHALSRSLLALASDPRPLPQLAAASRGCYKAFLDQSLAGFDQLLQHPKLKAARPDMRLHSFASPTPTAAPRPMAAVASGGETTG